MAKPDLIELSTDRKNALLVADRYTGVGGGSETAALDTHHAGHLLAALLLIANKEGYGYGWISAALENQWHILEPIQRELRDGPKSDTDVPVDVLRTIWRREDGLRGDIFATAT